MNRSDRLQPISKIRKQQERNAGRLHGESIRQTELQKKQLNELIDYRDQYSETFKLAGESGLSAIQLLEYRLFISRLDDAIIQQKQHVVNGETRCDASQKEWMQKRNSRKMIDKVVENRQQAEHDEREKREQKEMEDRPYGVPYLR
ncbi:MAG: flagellar export protein FliJ [Gammaproteobacteria bacterium]|nr:MAG: flagellar export protein FliJ [Gammaproteobacteria bacterium]